jgi:hypothetical protein
MARPTTAMAAEKAAREADLKIKAKLPELVEVLLKAAVSSEAKCPKCRTPLPGKGDPKVALALLERALGKPDVAKAPAAEDRLASFLEELAKMGKKAVEEGATPASHAPAPEMETDPELVARALRAVRDEDDDDA